MIRQTNSHQPLPEIMYKVGSNGRANIWIRQNEQIILDSEEQEMYYYNEVYFTADPELISLEDVQEDLQFYFDIMSGVDDGFDANRFSISELKKSKHDEMSYACQQTIISGIDVEINGETQHFSLNEYDQLNLIGLQNMIESGAEYIPYHVDGMNCVYYTAEDASKILEQALAYKLFHTTYCNSLFNWIGHLDKASELYAINYGMMIPEQYQSVVLKDLLSGTT